MALKRINLSEIHDVLANQLFEISDNKTTGKVLDEEIKKAHAMSGLASNIINLSKVQLQAYKQFGKDDEAEGLFLKPKEEKPLPII